MSEEDVPDVSDDSDVGGEDEFTPRERGLMIGYEFASTWPGHSPDDREMLERMADGEMPADVWEEILDGGMRERLDASVDFDAEEACRRGFADGVRASIVEARDST